MAYKKKKLEEGLGIKKDDKDRCVAVNHVIDTNKRTPKNREPKMTE